MDEDCDRDITVALRDPLRWEGSWWILCFDGSDRIIYSRVGLAGDYPIWDHAEEFEVGRLPEKLKGSEVAAWVSENLDRVRPYLTQADPEGGDDRESTWMNDIVPMIIGAAREARRRSHRNNSDRNMPVRLYEDNGGGLVIWDPYHFAAFDVTEDQFTSSFEHDARVLRNSDIDSRETDCDPLDYDGWEDEDARGASLVAEWHPDRGVTLKGWCGSAARTYLGLDNSTDDE